MARTVQHHQTVVEGEEEHHLQAPQEVEAAVVVVHLVPPIQALEEGEGVGGHRVLQSQAEVVVEEC